MAQPRTSVLLVDHTRDEREMYAEYLHVAGYLALEAKSAEEGWQLAMQMQPGLIVTDLVLPGPDNGLDLVARLKQDERTRHLPVIVLTGRVYDADRADAARAGADLFLPKPCLPSDLVREIRLLIARSRVLRVRSADRRVRTAKAQLPPDEFAQRPRKLHNIRRG